MIKMFFAVVFCCFTYSSFAQTQKAKPVFLPYNEYYTWYQNPLIVTFNCEAWSITMIHEPPQFAVKQLQYFYIQAEKQTQAGVKSKVSVHLVDGKMLLWFVQIGTDGVTKPITEQNFNEEEKSLFEELKKVSKTK